MIVLFSIIISLDVNDNLVHGVPIVQYGITNEIAHEMVALGTECLVLDEVLEHVLEHIQSPNIGMS